VALADTVEVEANERRVTYRMNRDDLPSDFSAIIDALRVSSPEATAGNISASEGIPAPRLDQPAIETKADFDEIDGAALAPEQADILGGDTIVEEIAPRDAGPFLPFGKGHAGVDPATIARRFGHIGRRA